MTYFSRSVAGYKLVFSGDVVIIGWLAYYSDEAEESSLFLEQAAWIDKDQNERSIDGPGILITKEVGIEYVVFLRARDEVKEERSIRVDASSE